MKPHSPARRVSHPSRIRDLHPRVRRNVHAASPTVARSDKALTLSWPHGLRIVFALDHGQLLGIRSVRINAIALRNPAKLWRPLVTTPDGIHYGRFELHAVRLGKNGSVFVSTTAIGSATTSREEQDEYLGDVFNLALPDAPVNDTFEWEFAPSRQVLDGSEFLGFSFRYRFTSRAGRKISRVFDDASWEIGGHVRDNTLLLQGQVNPPVTELRKDLYFTTACNYYGAELRGLMGPPKRISFQRLPRIGTLQAFDLLVHPRGALLGLFDPLHEVLSVVQKERGEDVLHVFDERRGPLSSAFTTEPKHILFHRAPRAWSREDQRNLWHRVYSLVHDGVRKRYRVTPSPVQPRVWIPQHGADKVTFAGRTYPREAMLRVLADHALPRWADMGVKEICMHSLWVSDYTVDRLKFKDQTGMHGGLVVGSICNVRIHEIDPLWGGPDALAYFVQKAHVLGLQVQLWWASHLSRRAPIFAERPDFMLMARDGLPNGGGFGHQTIITVDLNNPDCFDWMFSHLKTLYDRVPFDGLFHDSYGNMTFLPMNYADARRRGQQDAYGRLVHKLQQTGIRTFTVEGIGPLGVGHFGMDLIPKHGKRGRGYQCALDWWLGQEDMMTGLNMGIGLRPWSGRNPDARQFAFRCMASGGRIGFTDHDGSLECWTGWLRDLNRLHRRLVPIRGRRTLLPHDQGVVWDGRDGDRLVFTYRPFVLPIDTGTSVASVSSDGEVALPVTSPCLQARPWRVYRISRA